MPRQAISSVVGLGGFVAYFTGGFVNELTGQILQKTGTANRAEAATYAARGGLLDD